AIVRDGNTIDASCLSPAVAASGEVSEAATQQTVADTPSASAPVPSRDGGIAPLKEARNAFEVGYLRDALTRASGNVSQAARMLGLSRVSLQKKMKAFGLR